MVVHNYISADEHGTAEKTAMHIERTEHVRSRREINESALIEVVSWLIIISLFSGIVFTIKYFDKIFG